MIAELRRAALKLFNFLFPGRGERAFDRELGSHLALLEDEYQRRGMAPEDAAREARRTLGSVSRLKDLHRDERTLPWLEDARLDLRYAARGLSRAPGFTFVAVFTLALGIGSVTVIYSVIHDVLLDPLPYPASERFVNVRVVDTETGRALRRLPAAEFLDYEEQSDVFEEVIGARGEAGYLETDEGTRPLRRVLVTPNFFDVMGVGPLLGRTTGPEDTRPDAPLVAVLRHQAWVERLGGDPKAVGGSIRLNGELRTIVGVMPPRFTWHGAGVWIPVPIEREGPTDRTAARNFQGRLKLGVTLEQAEAQLNVVAARRARTHPDEYPKNFRIEVVNVIADVVGNFRGVLLTALAAVALLLLIACCNVASMLLARATSREREMSVRAALGAGRARIVRMLLTESLLLALGGAALGGLLAYAGIEILVKFLPRGPLPGEVEFGLDGAALFVSLAVAGLSAIFFGVAPALYGARRDLVEGLGNEGRGIAGGGGRWRNTLVIVEIGLSLVLLLGAGLLMRSFTSLVNVDLGLDPRRLLVAEANFPPGAYEAPGERYEFHQEALRRLRAIPGVEAAGAATGVPVFARGRRAHVRVPGRPESDQSLAWIQYQTEDYFRAAGQTLLQGQAPLASAGDGQRTAVVNQAFATSFLGSGEPLGRHVVLGPGPEAPDEPGAGPVEIVGVVKDIRNDGPTRPPAPQVYMRTGRSIDQPYIFAIRVSEDRLSSSRTIRRELAGIDKGVVVAGPNSIERLLRDFHHAQPRFSLIVLGVFAVTGTLLVAVGVFGVMAYTVSRRRREIAVRMALGAGRGQIVAGVLRLGASLLLAGVATGTLASLATSRLLESQLWSVSPHDPATLVAAIGVVSAVALAACLVPARRATRIDLVTSLRQE